MRTLEQVKSESGSWTHGGYLDAAVPINHCVKAATGAV